MIEIVPVDATNVEQTGFFCSMSKPDSEGHRKKLEWLRARFAEGLRLKLVRGGGRGFIEYIPGEFAWRAIRASEYMVVHCLWVVGKAKGQGCATALLNECIRDANAHGMAGVAAIAATHQTGLTDTGFFLRRGFEVVDTAPSGADLVALKFRNARNPEFAGDWDRKLAALGPGLSVVWSGQCPYLPELAQKLVEIAQGQKVSVRTVEMRTAAQVREESPCPYGAFGMAYNGTLLPRMHHNVNADKLMRAIRSCAHCEG